MNIMIRGENVEVTPALRDYVEKKVGRVERYFDPEATNDIHVTLKVLKDVHTVEVTIPLPGLLLRAEDHSEDMYASIDSVIDKLERQIRKHKTKVNRRFRDEGGLKTLFVEGVASNIDVEEEDIRIVRTKSFDFKPMDAEEAILQMNLVGHSFFVFSNAETDEVNVVYKRKDGRYGLIEPR